MKAAGRKTSTMSMRGSGRRSAIGNRQRCLFARICSATARWWHETALSAPRASPSARAHAPLWCLWYGVTMCMACVFDRWREQVVVKCWAYGRGDGRVVTGGVSSRALIAAHQYRDRILVGVRRHRLRGLSSRKLRAAPGVGAQASGWRGGGKPLWRSVWGVAKTILACRRKAFGISERLDCPSQRGRCPSATVVSW